MSPGAADAPRRAALVAAFAAVYLIWGSTYLAIKFAVASLPPFLMTGSRFLVAGTILYAWVRARGAPAPTARQWRSAALVGVLLLVVGNGLVSWSELRVPSGLAALIVAVIPLWMVLFAWGRGDGGRPGLTVFAGLALGLAGLALLLGTDVLPEGRVDLLGGAALLVATLAWAYGSVRSRSLEHASSPLAATAMQMLVAGAALLGVGSALGEWRGLDLAAAETRSWLAWLWLVVPGSLVAFTCYVWLLRVSTPAKVSTYAYVNPVVAVALGWALAGEALTLRIGVAAVLIVGAVALITLSHVPPREPHEPAAPPRAGPPAAPEGRPTTPP